MKLIPLIIKEAFISIFRHKLRSFFAVLGVMVGIAAVISLVSIGKGVEKDVTKTVEGIGTNLIVVLSGKIETDSGGFNQSQMSNPANFISGDILKREDADEISKIEGVKAVAPIALAAGSVRKGDKVSGSMIMGTNPPMKDVMSGFEVKYGRFIEDSDSDQKKIVVADMIREQLFEGKENIVGEKVEIGKDEFEIIGQLQKPKDAGELFSSDYDSVAIITMDQAKRINGGEDKIMRIAVSANDSNTIDETVERIKQNMLLRHKDDEFSVLTQEELLDMFSSIINILTSAVSAIGAISLIVGGIGISSVMFMSVADRTREIGIRKALGATGGVITLQFLIESIILSILGGAFGLFLSLVVNRVVAEKTVIEPHLTSTVVVLSVVFCTLVGVIFGLIPAIRASLKDPVEALREG
ncbi:MAG: Macrolide export ATP-binding/permease protein MacB [candidate division WS2 bacterium ADurb.Bin280]|uniref:Macrolide export ATP-binding/permease protein MacB n=1 Tax=candidate division WS2 bacterium ADurb.Bin280 TaxID=1852829 RepID=A0A1V5SE39_9BACT|nr:MAG: Macrolide export ATP-binding/permease protein MacB [candidate division WS2 bacterium ADurb.Bin280]